MTYYSDGRRGPDTTEQDRYWAQKQQARLQTEQEERQRNHAAWLRLCGSVAPIGKLSD